MLKSEFSLIILCIEREKKINYKYLNFILFIRSCSLRINLTKSREELKASDAFSFKIASTTFLQILIFVGNSK